MGFLLLFGDWRGVLRFRLVEDTVCLASCLQVTDSGRVILEKLLLTRTDFSLLALCHELLGLGRDRWVVMFRW